jgi:hypothetical protein
LKSIGYTPSPAEEYMLREYLTEVTANVDGGHVNPLWYSYASMSPTRSEYKTFPVMMEYLFNTIAAHTGC